MKIIFIDEKSQIEEIKNYTTNDCIIISLKPHCSISNDKKLFFFQFFLHHEEWKNYYKLIKVRLNQLLKIKFKLIKGFSP